MNLNHHAEQVAITVSKNVSIIGGGTAAAGGTAEKIGLVQAMGVYGAEIASACAIGGFLLAVAGFAISIYFQWRRDRREERALRGDIKP